MRGVLLVLESHPLLALHLNAEGREAMLSLHTTSVSYLHKEYDIPLAITTPHIEEIEGKGLQICILRSLIVEEVTWKC